MVWRIQLKNQAPDQRLPWHERITYIGIDAPQFEILQTRAHSKKISKRDFFQCTVLKTGKI